MNETEQLKAEINAYTAELKDLKDELSKCKRELECRQANIRDIKSRMLYLEGAVEAYKYCINSKC